ncbi:hypothetical protein [Cellvibrio sp. UBA7661]|uniref:hypothetical protein n=1 Tax=Cellvibrio sp. UBA7661 TaxID=1946311 RepID=UPI002F3576CE
MGSAAAGLLVSCATRWRYRLLTVSAENNDLGNKAAAVLSLVDVINVIIIKKSVEWWNTLHQPASIMKGAIDISMLIPLLINMLGMYILYLALLFAWTRIEILRQESKKQWVKEVLTGAPV